MRKVLSLTAVLLKTAGASLEIKMGRKGGKLTTPIFWALMVVCMLPLMLLLYSAFGGIFAIFHELGDLAYATGLVTNAGGVVVLFFSLLSIPSLFYFSKDVESLLPMPLSPAQIIAAKFITALFFELLASVFVVVPMTAALWPYVPPVVLLPNAVITFFTMPVMPLVYATLVIMVLVRVTRIGRNKDFFNLLVGVLGVAFGVVIGLFSSRFTSMSVSEEQLMEFVNGNSHALGILRSVFPNNVFSSIAISGGGTAYQFLNFAVLAACLAVFLMFARNLYFKGVIGISEASASNVKMTGDDVRRGVKSQNFFAACFRKEMRVMFRSPVTFTNCVMMVYLMPLILFGSAFFSLQGQGIDLLALIDVDYSNPELLNWLFIGAMAVGFFFSAMNTASATSISREGSNFFVMKYLPVPMRTQLMAKAASCAAITIPAMLLTFTAAEVIMKAPLHIYLGMTLLSLPGGLFLNYVGLLADVYHPKLDWENEAYAVRQNLNVTVVILGGMFLTVPVALLGFLLSGIAVPAVTFVILLLASVGLAVGSHFLVLNLGEKRLGRLE